MYVPKYKYIYIRISIYAYVNGYKPAYTQCNQKSPLFSHPLPSTNQATVAKLSTNPARATERR